MLKDELKIVEQANISSLIPKTIIKSDDTIVDTDATSHYLTKDATVNKNAQENKI